MIYLVGVLLLALVGCAVTIRRLSGEIHDLTALLREAGTTNHYLRECNRQLNGELLTASVTRTVSTSALGRVS